MPMLTTIRDANGRYVPEAVRNIESWGYKGLREDEKPSPPVTPVTRSWNPEEANGDNGTATRERERQLQMIKQMTTQQLERYLPKVDDQLRALEEQVKNRRWWR